MKMPTSVSPFRQAEHPGRCELEMSPHFPRPGAGKWCRKVVRHPLEVTLRRECEGCLKHNPQLENFAELPFEAKEVTARAGLTSEFRDLLKGNRRP